MNPPTVHLMAVIGTSLLAYGVYRLLTRRGPWLHNAALLLVGAYGVLGALDAPWWAIAAVSYPGVAVIFAAILQERKGRSRG